MTNHDFLDALSQSFRAFLESTTSRSTAKLKPLHGAIAIDMASRFPDYTIHSQGYKDDKEGVIPGRYLDKHVDILIEKDGTPRAGIGVKFIMQNYSQNSVNYFENMLGETANIRCCKYPYFQVMIVFDEMPHYNDKKKFIRWDTFSAHNVAKYLTLSNDNPDVYLHTPNKMLIYVLQITPKLTKIATKQDYLDYYKEQYKNQTLTLNTTQQSSQPTFGSVVILNDYERFAEKIFYTVKSIY